MSTEDEALSQEALDAILARALEARDRPEDQPVFGVCRDIFPSSRVIDCPGDNLYARISLYNEDSGRHLALGALVRSRRVGAFDVRLVRALDAVAQEDVWRVVASRSRGDGAVVLTYSSGSARAHEVAARYAEEATKVDLTSDFDSAAHFFGERRVPRSS